MKAILTSFAVLLSLILSAQHSIQSGSSIEVSGSSSVQGWEETTSELKGSAVYELDGSTLKSLSSVSVSFKAESLESGNSTMNKHTYSALKTKDYPTIKFESKDITIQGNTLTAKTNVTIAGKTKPMTLKATYKVVNGQLQINGTTKFNMTGFDVEPPSLMFGTMNVRDEVSVKVDLRFK